MVGAISWHPTVLGYITKQAEQATRGEKKKARQQRSSVVSTSTPPSPGCFLWAWCFITAITRMQCHLYKIPTTLAKCHAQRGGGGEALASQRRAEKKKLSTFAEQALCRGSDL